LLKDHNCIFQFESDP